MFDETLAKKSRQAPNVETKLQEFITAKQQNPIQSWGSKDKPFPADGPIGRMFPKLRYAHLTSDIILFYTMEGRDPITFKLYGVFSHDDIGIGMPRNINRQKSLLKKLAGQPVVAEGLYDADPPTYNLPRRQLNVPELIKRGAIFVVDPHGPNGWEPDAEGFSLVTLYNVAKGGWPAEARQHLKPSMYKAAESGLNRQGPGSMLYDGKYNQILWSIKKLGIPDNVAFLDQDIAENFAEGEVIPFRRPQAQPSLPADILHLASEWFHANDDTNTLQAVTDPGYGQGAENLVKYIQAKLQSRGWTIDFDDEIDNIVLTNRSGQTVALPVADAYNETGWAKGTMAENFADGRGPGRPGDSQRHGIPKGATMAELEKASHSKGRKGQLARWQLNMRRGKAKAK